MPDQETPAEEVAEEVAQQAAEEGDQEGARDGSEAPAGQPGGKTSIFTFAPKEVGRMRDWAVAIVLGALLAGAVFALPVLAALTSVLLAPALSLVAAILGIWFLLQVLKEGDNPRGGQGPDPWH